MIAPFTAVGGVAELNKGACLSSKHLGLSPIGQLLRVRVRHMHLHADSRLNLVN